MKNLCVIQRECVHKIDFLDSKSAKISAKVINVKLDKEEEYLAPSLIKLTKKIEKESQQYAHFCQCSGLTPRTLMMLSEKIFVGFKRYRYRLVTSVMSLLTNQTKIWYASNMNLQLEFEKSKDVSAEEAMYDAEDDLHDDL